MDLNSPRMKRPQYSNPNLGRNGFAKLAQKHVMPFMVVALLVVGALKLFLTPLEPLVVHIALMTLVLITAYFLGFNKPGIGRTGKHMLAGMKLCAPLLVVGVPMAVLSVVYSGSVTPDHNAFDIAYQVFYYFAMCYLQDALLCGIGCNLLHKTETSAKAVQQKLIAMCTLWSLFYVLNGPSNATIAQVFGTLMLSLFLCSVYLRVQNLWAVALTHGLCYCLMAVMALVSSQGFFIFTADSDSVMITIFLVLHAILLIPMFRNLQTWEQEKKTAEARMLAEKKAPKEKIVIRRGVKQKKK